MNESTGVDYLSPWQLNETIEGLGGIGVIEQVQVGGNAAAAAAFESALKISSLI